MITSPQFVQASLLGRSAKTLLVTAFTIATLVLPRLSAMDQASRIEEEIEQQSGQSLYDLACAFVATNSADQVQAHFNGPLRLQDGESVYKNAIRFAYAQQYGQDVDNVRCVAFLRDCNKYWVNTENATALYLGSYAHELLTEKYLKHVIPLLEPVLKQSIRCLHLASTFLNSLPENLQLLTQLELLDLYSTEKGILGFCVPGFYALPLWLAQMPLLKKIIVGPHFTIFLTSKNNPFQAAKVSIWVYLPDGRLFRNVGMSI